MKCGAWKVVLFATQGSAPQRVLRGALKDAISLVNIPAHTCHETK